MWQHEVVLQQLLNEKQGSLFQPQITPAYIYIGYDAVLTLMYGNTGSNIKPVLFWRLPVHLVHQTVFPSLPTQYNVLLQSCKKVRTKDADAWMNSCWQVKSNLPCFCETLSLCVWFWIAFLAVLKGDTRTYSRPLEHAKALKEMLSKKMLLLPVNLTNNFKK